MMKRSWFLLLAFGALVASAVALELKAPKNFVVIFADDFGYGDLGCYRELFQGEDDLTISHKFTPNLDKLGRDGVRFMQTYTASWCAPARSNLLSGRWCNRADSLTKPWIGKQMRDRGYATCFSGKSHGVVQKGMDMNPKTGGFSDALLFNNGQRNFYMQPGEELPRRTDFNSDPFVAEGGEYITDLFTDFGVDFIKRNAKKEKPFFLYLAYTATHSPLDGKLEDLQTMFPGDFDGIGKKDWQTFVTCTNGRRLTQNPKAIEAVQKFNPEWSVETSTAYAKMNKLGVKKFHDYNYAALAYSMDRGVAKIMQTLKEAGVDEDTLVIFTSDNGSISGSNYPLQNFKSTHFEGGIRVPMIFWTKDLAESAQSGRMIEEITPTTCIAPTLVGIADRQAKPDFPFDGINLWPYLAKNSPVPDDQVFFYAANSRFYEVAGAYRDMSYGQLGKVKAAFPDVTFGGMNYWERKAGVLNAVYIKGKEKIVYWSTGDGRAQGATYRKLPKDGRFSENPKHFFKEEYVSEGQFPQDAEGAAFLKEFKEYIAKVGEDELRASPIFNGSDFKRKKRADHYVK